MMQGNQTNVQAAMERITKRFSETISAKYAVDAEQMAKDNAPWEDRTGDARKLLKGKVIDEENAIGFRLMHRVEYGKYLETANSNKYAILKPTIEALRADFFKAAREIFRSKR